MAKPITDINIIQKFIFAGKAIFTLRSVKSNERYTYTVEEMPNKNTSDKRTPLYAVSLLTGPNNTSDYTYIGCIFGKKKFNVTKNSRLTLNSKPCAAFKWAVENYLVKKHVPATLEFWHEDRCARCRRPLTDDESIDTGFGPECSAIVGVERKRHTAGVSEQVLKGKFAAMRIFRNLHDDDGDAKFLALSAEAGYSIDDWEWFSKIEAEIKANPPRTVKKPISNSAYEGVNNGFREKSEVPNATTKEEILAMVEFQKSSNPTVYYGIREQGMSEEQIHEFWYRRFESIPIENFRSERRSA